MNIRTCLECRHCAQMDYGYSNYTVEGTEVACMLDVHPDGTFDRFYGVEKKLTFAAVCQRFEEGEGFELDCDRETLEDALPAHRAWFENYQSTGNW